MTKIEWTEKTWNPIVGCTIVSPGCANCYAMRMAARLETMAMRAWDDPAKKGKPLVAAHYIGTTDWKGKQGRTPVWTGKVALAPERILLEPLQRKRPTTYFVNSMGDLFHEDIPDDWIDRVFAVMALAPQHTFQVLTKRSARMRAYVNGLAGEGAGFLAEISAARRVYEEACDMVTVDGVADVILIAPGVDESAAPPGPRVHLGRWPLPNVWLGVSAERQQEADARIPDLLATPAAVRFVSAEPLLGPIDFMPWLTGHEEAGLVGNCIGWTPPLDWIIAGGESGPGARPMRPAWVRDIRDRAIEHGVAFFFKQWGSHAPASVALPDDHNLDDADVMVAVSKARGGRKLDGHTWNGMPERRP